MCNKHPSKLGNNFLLVGLTTPKKVERGGIKLKKYTIMPTVNGVYIGPYNGKEGKTNGQVQVMDLDFPGANISNNYNYNKDLLLKVALMIKYSNYNVENLKDFIRIDLTSFKIDESKFAEDFLEALIKKDYEKCDKYYCKSSNTIRLNIKHEKELIYLLQIFKSNMAVVSNISSIKDLIPIATLAIENGIYPEDFLKGKIFDVEDLSFERFKRLIKFRKELNEILKDLDLIEEHFLAYRNVNKISHDHNLEDLKLKLKNFVDGLSNDISPLRTLSEDQIIRLYDAREPSLINYASNILRKVHVFKDVNYEHWDGCYYSLYCISKQDGLMILKDELLPLSLRQKSEGRDPFFTPDPNRYHIAIGRAIDFENGLEELFLKMNGLY